VLDGVQIRVEGLMLARFVDRLTGEGVTVKRARRAGLREMDLWVSSRDTARLFALAEKHGLRAERIGARGWARWKSRARSQAALLIGILAVAGALMALNARVWLVEIRVVSQETQPGIEWRVGEALTSLGFKPGVASGTLDVRSLAAGIQLVEPSLTFVGVRVRGIRLLVELGLENPAPELYDLDAGRDLVALKDAVISSIDALTGVRCVKEGDTVRAGQVLIRGEERVSDELTRGVRALGVVMARAWYTAEASGSLRGEKTVDTGRASASTELRFREYAWRLTAGGQYGMQREAVERLPVVGLYVPVHIVRTTRYEQEIVESPIDRAALEMALHDQAIAAALAKLEPGDEIAGQWVDFTREGDILTARAVIEVRADIAVDRDTWIKRVMAEVADSP